MIALSVREQVMQRQLLIIQGTLGELDERAVGVPRMDERLSPQRVVERDVEQWHRSRVQVLDRDVDVWHLQRHVMNALASALKEPGNETIRVDRSDEFDLPSPGKTELSPSEPLIFALTREQEARAERVHI